MDHEKLRLFPRGYSDLLQGYIGMCRVIGYGFWDSWSLISCRVSSFPILALCSLRKCPAKQILCFVLNFQCYRNETKVFVFPFNRVTFFVLGLKLGTTFIWIILNKGQGLRPFATHTCHKITIVSPLTAYLRTSKQWFFLRFFYVMLLFFKRPAELNSTFETTTVLLSCHWLAKVEFGTALARRLD